MIRKILREPLVHFVGIAVIIHALSVGAVQSADRAEIVIDPKHVARIREQYRQQVGAEPGEPILDKLIESAVREEVLYREGLALNLGEEDIIVRRRIVQKMEFLVQESTLTEAVSNAVLEKLYEDYKAGLADKAVVSMSHRFFPGAAHDGAVEARRNLARLSSADCQVGVDVGTAWGGRTDISLASRTDLAGEFGHSPLVAAAFEVPVGGWQGPFESPYGLHLLCVRERRTPEVLPLAQVRGRLISEYQASVKQAQFDASMETLQGKYRVVLPEQG